MERPKVAILGCGPISDMHVPALKEAGFAVSAVASRPESTRLQTFASRHAIPHTFTSTAELLTARHTYDALVIAVRVEATVETLAAALATGVPILVEKPVAMRSDEITPFLPHSARVVVGFNRRFYATVAATKAEIERTPEPVLAHFTLPDAIATPNATDRTYLRSYFTNGVHGLDLLLHLFGDIELTNVLQRRDAEGLLTGFAALGRTPRGDLIQLTGNWRTPANVGCVFDRAGRRFELKPFEFATVYEGMEVVPPTPERPLRTYTPKVVQQIRLDPIDEQFKPGFVAQSQALLALLHGHQPDPRAARLHDARRAMHLAEQLAGELYPDVRP